MGDSSADLTIASPLHHVDFADGDDWNDSWKKYKTADARKQVIKYSCYICLKFGHRAFESRFLSPAITADKNTITLHL